MSQPAPSVDEVPPKDGGNKPVFVFKKQELFPESSGPSPISPNESTTHPPPPPSLIKALAGPVARVSPTSGVPPLSQDASPSDSRAAAVSEPVPIPPGLSPVYYALHLLQGRKLDAATELAAQQLRSLRPGESSSPLEERQLWFIQTKAMVQASWYDDVELDGGEDAYGDADLAQEHITATRGGGEAPGTKRVGNALALTRTAGGGSRQGLGSRYGFMRPESVRCPRPGQEAPAGSRRAGGGTAAGLRPITGRVMRLGTASLQSAPGGPHIHLERLQLDRFARERPIMAKLLCDYLLYVVHRPRMALELCLAVMRADEELKARGGSELEEASGGSTSGSAFENGKETARPALRSPSRVQAKSRAVLRTRGTLSSEASEKKSPVAAAAVKPFPSARPLCHSQVGISASEDWWWKSRAGKANVQLGLLREAEKWFKKALHDKEKSESGKRGPFLSQIDPKWFHTYHASTIMELGKVYRAMDQPLAALQLYQQATKQQPEDTVMLVCLARLQETLHDSATSFKGYSKVLQMDSSNVEALSCAAAHCFYEKNQPEVALRLYRRVLQMGLERAEVFNNIGLSAYMSSQFDYALSAFERSLELCEEDTTRADVWFNISHVGMALGDFGFSERALRIAIALDPTHGESLNNLAVLSLEKDRRSKRSSKKKQKASIAGETESVPSSHQVSGVAYLSSARAVAPFLEEPLYNLALVAYREDNLESAKDLVVKVLEVDPDHSDAKALYALLRKRFSQ